MKRLVTAVGADVGVVIDHAGERMYLVDELANEVPVEQELLLLVSLISRNGKTGSLAFPITTTSLVDELASGTGLEVRRTPVSLSALTLAAAQEGTVFAGSVGGGFVFPSFLPAYDAITSVTNLLQLLAPVERPLSDLVAELPQSTVVHRQVRCPWALKGTVMRDPHRAEQGEADRSARRDQDLRGRRMVTGGAGSRRATRPHLRGGRHSRGRRTTGTRATRGRRRDHQRGGGFCACALNPQVEVEGFSTSCFT